MRSRKHPFDQAKAFAFEWPGCVSPWLSFSCVLHVVSICMSSESMLEYGFLVWAKGRCLLGSYSQRDLGLGTLVSFYG